MPKGARNWLTPAAWVAAITAALLLVFPVGFPNYDTIYALVWGRELAHGVSPDYGAALPPTPHPLADLLGLVTTPIGDGAITVTMVVAYVSLALCGYLVYRLGTIWFDRWIGILAAAIVLTRAPFLSNGLRAYVDLPYIALCLGALTIEAKRSRAGWPVLTLLALAGLLRPEAWGFAIAYWLWLAFALRPTGRNDKSRGPTGRFDQAGETYRPVGGEEATFRPLAAAFGWELGWRGEREARELTWLAALALAGPILWITFDAITTGHPLYSLTGTQSTVETLERKTGPVDLLLYGPRALGEVLQWPGMVGALGGAVLGFAFLRRRSALGLVAAALALLGFAFLGAAGLAILARYTMLAAAILAIFVAVGLLGWRLLAPGHPWRRRWQLFAGVVLLMFVLWLPNQWDLDSTVNTDLTDQGRIENDLTDLVDAGAFEPPCGKIAVPNHRAVPRLAFGLEIEPTRIVSASEEGTPERGYFVKPASPFVIHNFILDPNDPTKLSLPVPPGFREVARNESWIVYRRC
ncbi:MAG TPA: hypothetical protein VFK14_11545 [Solirubrobacterales bacterium]|nr:hypothetical protein [Solirubrobacterales bacterium]